MVSSWRSFPSWWNSWGKATYFLGSCSCSLLQYCQETSGTLYITSGTIRVYNISWDINHQLRLLIELVPWHDIKSQPDKKLQVRISTTPHLKVEYSTHVLIHTWATSGMLKYITYPKLKLMVEGPRYVIYSNRNMSLKVVTIIQWKKFILLSRSPQVCLMLFGWENSNVF